MSDERLRELERRWQETGAVEDKAAYLRARLRADDLERKRLELAAYLGDAAARDVLGADAPPNYDAREAGTAADSSFATALVRSPEGATRAAGAASRGAFEIALPGAFGIALSGASADPSASAVAQ